MKNLGFGLMRLPLTKKTVRSEKIDKVQSAEMIKAYLDEGYTYFDTAYMYHGGKSESAAGELICEKYGFLSITFLKYKVYSLASSKICCATFSSLAF